METKTKKNTVSALKRRVSNTLAAVIAVVLLPSLQAQAASVSYFLDQSNSRTDGADYLKVTLDDEGVAGAINFTVDVLSTLTSGNNFGIQNFGFNGSQLSASNIVFTGESAEGWRLADNNGSMSEFGKFSNLLATTGNHRVDSLTFSIVGIAGDSMSDYIALSKGNGANQSFFAAHVAGFSTPNGTGAYFAGSAPAPVPVPAAAWLFGSGLAGLVGSARRRRAKTI